MAAKICVIGTGYVGLIAAVGLSDFGNIVVGVDLDRITSYNVCYTKLLRRKVIINFLV